MFFIPFREAAAPVRLLPPEGFVLNEQKLKTREEQ